MYIISGKYKKRRLANYKNTGIRPAMALVRKSIFDSIQSLVDDSNILDLCAGSGILGIEALSRGARSLTLVDSDKQAVDLIRKNLDLCNAEGTVILGRLPGVLKRLNPEREQFNVIFLDPPYGNAHMITDVLQMISNKKLLKDEGLISIETESRCAYKIPENMFVYREKLFGNTKVVFLKVGRHCNDENS